MKSIPTRSGHPGRLLLARLAAAALTLVSAVAAAVDETPATAPVPRPPNVLFIAADDLNNDLGCYGHPLVRTPHLDRLAAAGVRFDLAYCQTALCNPSRASVLTGRRPDTTRVFDNIVHFRQALPEIATLPQHFMAYGYRTGRVGKIYHYGNPGQIGTPGMDDPPSWQVTSNPAGRDKTRDEPDIIQYTGNKGSYGASLSWLDPDDVDDAFTDGMVAAEAIRLMQEWRDEPFFLAVGFYRPHTPYVAPRRYFDLYPPAEELPLAPRVEGDWDDIPEMAATGGADARLDDTQRRLLRRAYWASVSFVDAQVGRLVAALDELGLRESTIIVFWSDHGYHLGEHQLWQKRSNFEESARVPLLISVPGAGWAHGRACGRTVELLDLYPTLAEVAGLPAPAGVEGASLRRLLADPAAPWDRPAYTQNARGTAADPRFGRSVRTERWRYTEWGPDGADGAELYDHAADPREYTNLAARPEQAETVATLRTLLRRAGAP